MAQEEHTNQVSDILNTQPSSSSSGEVVNEGTYDVHISPIDNVANMSLTHDSTQPATIPELDIFSLPLTQTANEGEYCLQIRPMSTVTANSAVEFVFGCEGRDYLDLARSRLYVKLKLLHAAGTD